VTLLRRFQLRSRSLFNRSQVDADLNDELQDYLEHQTERFIASGCSPEEARLAAWRSAGGVEQVKEECRDARGTAWVENALQDVRYAWRTLKKNREFAFAAICTLALGIGANTAWFSVMNAVVIRPLPYRDPGRLVGVKEAILNTGEIWSFSYPDYLDCVRQSTSFESMAAHQWDVALNLTSPGEPEFLYGRAVSASFLDVLGVKPLLGRNFSSTEDQHGAQPVAIIDYALWQQRFNGRRDAIGRRMVMNGKGFTVVGVLPAGFRFFSPYPVLTPIGQGEDAALQNRSQRLSMRVVARLKPGVELAQANADLKVIAERLARTYPETNTAKTFQVISLKEEVVGAAGQNLLLVGGPAGLLLLIACVNVANLFLARAVSREREFQVRAALGASSSRILCQLLTESLMLSLVGGAVGVTVAAAAGAWASSLPEWLPRAAEISIDPRVLLFSLLLSVFTGVAFGITPAWRQRLSLDAPWRQGARGSSGGIRRRQSIFMIAELSLTLLLLAAAGLTIRTIWELSKVNPGFDSHNLLTANVLLPTNDLDNAASLRNDWRQMLERVRSVPGVEAAALDMTTPLAEDPLLINFWLGGGAARPSHAILFTPSPDYLRVMKIPLLRGRFFTEQDRNGSQPVIVVDETFARRVFPGKEAVGNEVSLDVIGKAQIIGVVGNTKHTTLDEAAGAPPAPTIYTSGSQWPDSSVSLAARHGIRLLVRTSDNPESLLNAVKRSVIGPRRDTALRNLATMKQVIENSLASRSAIAWLLGVFAFIALSLAAVGIYSVVSYGISRRVPEIGIRMALGARSPQVFQLVLVQATKTILIGVVAGLVASFLLTRLLAKLLFGVAPLDPLTFAAATVALCSIALLAVFIPARRAARIDPCLALRHE
jgi:predicted permease